MKRSKRLQIVLELSQETENKAAEAYEMATRQLNDDAAKLDELGSYYTDYEQEFSKSTALVRAEDIARQRGFLAQLADAMRQQAQVIQQRKKIAETKKQIWQKAHLKRRALTDLIERLKVDEAKVLSRKEEKMLDEWFLQTSHARSHSSTL